MVWNKDIAQAVSAQTLYGLGTLLMSAVLSAHCLNQISMQIKLINNLLQCKRHLSLLRDGIRVSNFYCYFYFSATQNFTKWLAVFREILVCLKNRKGIFFPHKDSYMPMRMIYCLAKLPLANYGNREECLWTGLEKGPVIQRGNIGTERVTMSIYFLWVVI
jgi:hypothetical protein